MNKVLPHIIFRHAQDAAWHFSQMEADRAAPLIYRDRARHYQNIFQASMDGLFIAGDAGFDAAMAEFEKWKGAGEFFVCWLLALRAGDERRLDAVIEILAQLGEQAFFDAAAAAFMWADAPAADECLSAWLHGEQSAFGLRLALNACGLRRKAPDMDITPLFTHEDFRLKAEACRLTARLRLWDFLPHIRQALQNESYVVREEAAVAFLLLNEPGEAVEEMRAAVTRHARLAVNGKGLARLRAETRATHLARLLGHALPFPCPENLLNEIIEPLPAYLRILALAHHGDPAHMALLSPLMGESGPYARLALWALCFVRGLDAEDAGLCRPSAEARDCERADEPDAFPGLGADLSLPVPDQDKAAEWIKQNAFSGAGAGAAPMLGGKIIRHAADCARIIRHGSQAECFAAAMHACRLSPAAPWIDTRMPLPMRERLAGMLQ